MTIGKAAVERIGRTPEGRVRWFLTFAMRDLRRLSPARLQTAWDALFALQSQQSVRVPVHPETLAETQRQLRECVEALANGRPYTLTVPEMSWALSPPARRPKGGRRSAPVIRHSAEARVTRAPMPSVVVFAFVDDLNVIGADRLRACPFESDGARCGHVLLATRRQEYCSRKHAQAAAWRTYSASPKRKQTRR